MAFIKARTSASAKRRQKSPGGRRMGITLSSERVEIDLIVAPQLEVFEPLAAGEDIEGDVEHVVGFVVGPMLLEQMEVPVDLLVELDLPSQEQDGPDATGGESPGATGRFIVDIGGGHHGYGPLGPGGIGQTSLDPPPTILEGTLLACGAPFSESGTHSKAPFFWNSEDVFVPLLFQKPAGLSSFFSRILPGGLYITLG